jgi:hypothetical protein
MESSVPSFEAQLQQLLEVLRISIAANTNTATTAIVPDSSTPMDATPPLTTPQWHRNPNTMNCKENGSEPMHHLPPGESVESSEPSYANDQYPDDMDFSEHVSSPSEGGVNDRTMSRDLSPEVTSRRKRSADDQDHDVSNYVVLDRDLYVNNLTVLGKFYQLSDARYKIEIRSFAATIPDFLERFKQIEPKVYKLANAPEIGTFLHYSLLTN